MGRRHATLRGIEERNRLVVQWRFLPRNVVHRHRDHPAVRRLGWETAIAEGLFALIRAAELWDPAKHPDPQNYFRRSIWLVILRAAENSLVIHVPKHVLAQAGQYPRCTQAGDAIEEHAQPAGAGRHERTVELRQQYDGLAAWFLTHQERFCLAARMEGQCYDDIAIDLGVTKQRVEQITKAAIKRLRQQTVWGNA